MRVVGYIRVSSKEQAEEGYSLQSQRELIEAYCTDRALNLTELFHDVETGGKDNRPGFQALVKRLKADRSIKAVVAWRLDRLLRNFKSYVTLDELKTKLLFVIEDYPDNATGRLLLSIKVSLARHFLEALGENVRAGMIKKAQTGHYPSFAPLGYINTPQGLAPDPTTAALIRRLFLLYAEGASSLTALANFATSAGLGRSSPRVGAGRVLEILRSPLYAGMFIWGKKLYDGKHAPIVEPGLWALVQEMLRERSRKTRKGKHTFAFSRLLLCPHCKCFYAASLAKKRYVYYACSKKRVTRASRACESPYVREETVSRHLSDALAWTQVVDLTPEIMRSIVWNAWYDGRTLVPTYRPPYDALWIMRIKSESVPKGTLEL